MQRLSRNLVLPTRLRLVQLATGDILVLRVTRCGGIAARAAVSVVIILFEDWLRLRGRLVDEDSGWSS